MKIYQKLAVTTAGAVLSFATIATATQSPAQAATVGYSFTANVSSGPLAGNNYEGNFSYDDSTLTGNGLESLGVAQGLSINFDFLGKTYTAQDAVSSGYDPQVSFEGGNLLGLRYPVGDTVNGYFIGNLQAFIGGSDFYLGSNIGGFGTQDPVGTVVYSASPVPEPSEVGGILVLGLGFLLKRKGKTSPISTWTRNSC